MGEIRAKEIAKLRKKKFSRQKLMADLKQPNGHKTYVETARALDLNLDTILDVVSPGKGHALGHVMEDLTLRWWISRGNRHQK